MAFRAAALQLELVEDSLSLSVAWFCLPLRTQPRVDLVEPVVCVEDAPHDELRRHRPVPVVLLEAERNVVTPLASIAVEPCPLSERDRASRITPVAVHSEAQMLAVS